VKRAHGQDQADPERAPVESPEKLGDTMTAGAYNEKHAKVSGSTSPIKTDPKMPK
jgi:hypothetical protein